MFDIKQSPFQVELHAHFHPPVRVVIDPNEYSVDFPGLSPVFLEDLPASAHVGMSVVAAQPDDEGGPDFITSATVKVLDERRRVAFLAVDWDDFHDEEPASAFGEPTATSGGVFKWKGTAIRHPETWTRGPRWSVL